MLAASSRGPLSERGAEGRRSLDRVGPRGKEERQTGRKRDPDGGDGGISSMMRGPGFISSASVPIEEFALRSTLFREVRSFCVKFSTLLRAFECL